MSTFDLKKIGIAIHFFPFSWAAKIWAYNYGATACVGPFRFTAYWDRLNTEGGE